LLDAVFSELDEGEFATLICIERLQPVPHLYLRDVLVLLDGICYLILGMQQPQSHVSIAIVDEEQKVPAPGWRCWCNRPTTVTMDQLQSLLCMVLSVLRKRRTAVLAGHAPAAHLVQVMHLRQTLHHVIPREFAQSWKIEMTKSCMPQPRILQSSNCQAHMSTQFYFKQI
jgi:hypothetical protein